MRDVFLDPFMASFETPRHLMFDLAAVDDPAPSYQRLTFWQVYSDQNQYLAPVLTCPDNDQFVILWLRLSNAPAALGADDLAYPVSRLRRDWPDAVLQLRGDCGFGVPDIYEVCDRLNVLFAFGLSTNAVLRREPEVLLAEAAGPMSGSVEWHGSRTHHVR